MKKLLPKIEEISNGKAHTNSRKLIWNILMVTDVFLNQKKVNVCEHMAKMSVTIEIFQISFREFVCDFPLEISSIFDKSFLSFPIFCTARFLIETSWSSWD